MVLNDILEKKRKEVEELKRVQELAELISTAEEKSKKRRSFASALKPKKLHLICELKKASPSGGLLREDFNPEVLAQEFEMSGASALSILTERHYFKGNPNFLKQARSVTTIPLLRKDFIFDPYQVYETASLEADAFLAIAMLLSVKELRELIGLASQFKLDVLVETHTKEDLDRALEAGANMIGINNRNLKTLEVDSAVAENLIRYIPKNVITIIESGIQTREEILRYQSLGVNSFLIGTTFMKAANVRQKVLELYGKN